MWLKINELEIMKKAAVVAYIKVRFPDFMTSAQVGDKVVGLTHRPPLPPGNTPGTHFC
jgi:hypothetical protein